MHEARPAREITALLARARNGDEASRESLGSLVYEELERIAAAKMRRERQNHTWEPAVLVHEAFMRLVGKVAVNDRQHFYNLAAREMRRLLRDHAMKKRPAGVGGRHLTSLGPLAADAGQDQAESVALHEALEKLETIDRRAHDVVQLRFFGGLTSVEIANELEISERTVRNDWNAAVIVLRRMLSDARPTE